VDVVADAATWVPDREYDLVVCTEVFEHAERWRDICATAWRAAKPGGRLILTMAGPGRAGHSAVDGGPLRDGEYYRNVDPFDLSDVLTKAWEGVVVDQFRTDVRAIAVKPR
jgi:SAM-dependent methyltransferase